MNQVLYRPKFRGEKTSDPRLSNLHRSISHIFDDRLFPGIPATTADTASWTPNVDIFELDDAYLLHTDLPGVKAGDIEITLNQNVLTIKGSRSTQLEESSDSQRYEVDSTEFDSNEPKNNKTVRFTTRERYCGAFTRQFTLPELADGENISANSADGVLTLRIPKIAKAQPRTIKVSTQ